MDMKTCTGECGQTKPLTEFHKNSRNKTDGRASQCKVCRNKAVSKYAKDNPEARRKSQAAWRVKEGNKERARAIAKAWHQANKDRKAETNRAWYQDNKEKHAEYHKEYYRNNKAVYLHRARVRQQDLIDSIPEGQEDEVNRIWRECPDGYHVDHIYPMSKGGPTSVDNLCYLPATVNLSKSKKLPEGKVLHELLLKHAIIPAQRIGL